MLGSSRCRNAHSGEIDRASHPSSSLQSKPDRRRIPCVGGESFSVLASSRTRGEEKHRERKEHKETHSLPALCVLCVLCGHSDSELQLLHVTELSSETPGRNRSVRQLRKFVQQSRIRGHFDAFGPAEPVERFLQGLRLRNFAFRGQALRMRMTACV